MNERLALLQAIAENPHEDTPRMVFADWLDEFGDKIDQEWAAAIREGIETGEPGHLKTFEVIVRAWESVHQDRPTGPAFCPKWSRGFPSEVAAPLAWWLDRPAVLRYWPITYARATDYRPTWTGDGLYVWSWQMAVDLAGVSCARRLFGAMRHEYFSSVGVAQSSLSAALCKVSRRTSVEYDSLTGATC